MIRVFQQNLNHDQTAQDLLLQGARAEGCDFLIILDPYFLIAMSSNNTVIG